jgi:hypothetical protein
MQQHVHIPVCALLSRAGSSLPTKRRQPAALLVCKRRRSVSYWGLRERLRFHLFG